MRGYTVVLEPGRRIVKEEIDSGGSALPWIDEKAFLKRAVELAVNDFQLARSNADWVFFDRGLIDAISGLQHLRAASEFKPLLESMFSWHRPGRKYILQTKNANIILKMPSRSMSDYCSYTHH